MPAAYSAIILDGDEAVAFRDAYGMRPLWLGEKDGRFVAASESVGIRRMGGRPIREIDPGEAVFIRGNKHKNVKVIEKRDLPQRQFCFFEENYLSNEESRYGGRSVWDTRFNLGVQLAIENPFELDIVVPVPHCPEPYVYGFSYESGTDGVDALYKLKPKRTFIQPTDGLRQSALNHNLHLRGDAKQKLRGKRVGAIDDSIIRGDTSRHVVRLLREAGASEVYILSGTPPVGDYGSDAQARGCLFGVDMPVEDNFIAREHGPKEIADRIEANGVYYLSVRGLEKVRGLLNNFCTYCIGGKYPIRTTSP